MAATNISDWLMDFRRPEVFWYAMRLAAGDTLALGEGDAGSCINRNFFSACFRRFSSRRRKIPMFVSLSISIPMMICGRAAPSGITTSSVAGRRMRRGWRILAAAPRRCSTRRARALSPSSSLFWMKRRSPRRFTSGSVRPYWKKNWPNTGLGGLWSPTGNLSGHIIVVLHVSFLLRIPASAWSFRPV